MYTDMSSHSSKNSAWQVVMYSSHFPYISIILACKLTNYVIATVNKQLKEILLYKSQPDAHVTEFILSDKCSTCFGCYYHPSSGAQTTVTTASGNRYTVTDRVKFTDKDYL